MKKTTIVSVLLVLVIVGVLGGIKALQIRKMTAHHHNVCRGSLGNMAVGSARRRLTGIGPGSNDYGGSFRKGVQDQLRIGASAMNRIAGGYKIQNG